MNSCLLTNAEYEVMEALWESDEPVKTRILLEKMKEKGRDWKRQTLNTLLFRLDEKGVLRRRRGEIYGYLSREDLMRKQTQGILDELYGGRIENFCAALAGNPDVSEEQKQKLAKLIDGWGK